jgi:hypothetical protein
VLASSDNQSLIAGICRVSIANRRAEFLMTTPDSTKNRMILLIKITL